ncbi:hypothetical protein MIMGU_mgv11b0101881mg, partial [Erythranthe guttata]
SGRCISARFFRFSVRFFGFSVFMLTPRGEEWVLGDCIQLVVPYSSFKLTAVVSIRSPTCR